MELCSKTHPEICYDAYSCPLCKDREAKEAEIAELKDKIDELNGIIIGLVKESKTNGNI